ncbi:MAG: Biotin lipoyl 2 protein [Patescibacteria group bacterium]|nr:Biotin lipoyl 2 protein [Patescibacteria group bacterium]
MFKNKLEKIKSLVMASRRNVIISGFLVVVFIGLVLFLIFGGNGNGEIVSADKKDLVETVKISGRVEADIVSDMGFAVTGIVRAVNVKEGDNVFAGQSLASLDLGTLYAQLRSARADVAIKRAELANTQIDLSAVKKKQDTLVESAYRTLLSSGLEAEPSSSTYTQTPPVVSGTYLGPEGRYKVIINRKSAGSVNDLELRTFDLESTPTVEISKTTATKLGTRGLYVSFSDDLTDYHDTIWYINLPNPKSTVYADNRNAYEEAVRERTSAIQTAESNLREGLNGDSIAKAQLERAEAEVSKIDAEIGERVISAPFAGVVTAVNIDPGESASANASAISIMSAGELGVKVDLPEIDSIKVNIGDTATVTIDALDSELSLPARVVSVNRSETIVDGVPVYEARLAFDTKTEQIASGMTADVVITTGRKDNVLAVPARAVRYRTDGVPYVVTIGRGGKETEKEVALGLRSTDGYIEIKAGLLGGEQVAIAK